VYYKQADFIERAIGYVKIYTSSIFVLVIVGQYNIEVVFLASINSTDHVDDLPNTH
jgi:hypothetical protein